MQYSRYNFEEADVNMLMSAFQSYEAECKRLLHPGEKRSTLPATITHQSSHVFNLLDAEGPSAWPSGPAISGGSVRWHGNVPSGISKSAPPWGPSAMERQAATARTGSTAAEEEITEAKNIRRRNTAGRPIVMEIAPKNCRMSLSRRRSLP